MLRPAWRYARALAFACGLLLASTATNGGQAQTLRIASLALDSQATEPFGLSAYQAPQGPLWVKWRGMEEGLAADAASLAQCRSAPDTCTRAAKSFLAVIEEARDLEGRQRLGVINRAINLAIRYTSDMAQYGVADLWSSPLATFASGQGDCEDYAIAKFLALREAGVAAADLRLLLAQNRTVNEAHAVLAARLNGRWLILDNRRMTLIDDEHVADLTPLFALDGDGIKQFGAPSAIRVAAAARPDVLPAAADRIDSTGTGGLPLVM